MPAPPSPDDRLERLAFECLERIAEEGPAALDRVCAAHPELADRLRSVVRQLESIGAVEPDKGTATPREFGEFRLLRQLGQGGMGVVWLAEQPAVGREVALKLLRPGVHDDPRARERFRREVRALSSLEHPGICAVYGAGRVGDTPYLAMRYVEGRTLAELLDERRESSTTTRKRTPTTPVERDRWLGWIEDIARALHAAHEAGIVHRDVKPGNVIVSPDGQPTVVDFGLARHDAAGQPTLTSAGHPVGTPVYMAPEQLEGEVPVDRRTDVYALGAMLFEALALQPPFVEHARERLYREILEAPPPNLRQFGVPSELCAVIEKALAKQPRHRFATALELAEELARFRRHEPVRTHRAGPLLRSARWAQRNPVGTAALLIVSAALVITFWALIAVSSAQSRLREFALIVEAERIALDDPWLAVKLGREAVRVSDLPEVHARFQRILFDAPNERTVREESNRLHGALFTADGALFVVYGVNLEPSVHRGRDGVELCRVPVSMTRSLPPLAISADGRRLAAAEGPRVRVYDIGVSELRLLRTLSIDGANRFVVRCAFRDDGCLVATDDAGNAAMWPAGAQRAVVLRSHVEYRSPLRPEFLPGGEIVAAGGLWSADGTRQIAQLDLEDATWARWMRDRLVTVKLRGRVRSWDRDGRELGDFAGADRIDDLFATVRCVDYAPDGDRIAVGYGDGRVHLIDVRTRALIEAWRAAESAIQVRFADDGQRVVTGDWDGDLALWELDGRLVRRMAVHREGISGIAVDPTSAGGGIRVVSASADGSAKLTSFAAVEGVPIEFDAVRAALGSRADGSLLVVKRGEVARFAADGSLVARAAVDARPPVSVSLTADEDSAVISSFDGGVWSWQLVEGAQPQRVAGPFPQWLMSAARLANGRLLLYRSQPTRVFVWNPAEPDVRPVESLKHGWTDLFVDVAADRRSFVAVTASALYRVGAEGEQRWQRPWEGAKRPVALSRDGARIAVGLPGGRIQLCDGTNGARLVERIVHEGQVNAIEFSPDGRFLASSSEDGTVRVWDSAGSAEPRVVGRTLAAIRDVAWIGTDRVATAGRDATVRWWWVDPGPVRTAVEALGLEELTADERATYAHLLRR